ncbi:MAG: hypothetical protein AB7F96_20085 [Beijerinckiaceae bacterium]
MSIHLGRTILATAGATTLAATASLALAQDKVAAFYKDKQVTLFVGFSAGGGYDLYARILAKHMGKHIPGKPTIVVNNMTGAGSVTLSNALYSTLPKDGTVFGEIGRGIPTEPLFANKIKLEINPIDGETVQKEIAELYDYPKDVVEAAVKSLTYEGNIKISKAVIPVETMTGKITAIGGGGRSITFNGGGKKKKARVSGRNTVIMVAGKEASRKALKEGLDCTLTYQGSAAKRIDCK